MTSFASPVRASDFTPLADGTIVVGGTPDPVGDPVAFGQAAHVVARDGSIVRSLGADVGPVRGPNPLVRSRTVAVSDSGLLAVARRLSYEIELLSPDGPGRVLRREVDWFPAHGDTALSHRVPMITKLWIDPADHLWVTIYLPRDAASEDDIYSDDPAVWMETIDFAVEVFALEDGELLASRRFRGPILTHQGVTTAPIVTRSGELRRIVWTPRLSRGSDN